MKFNFTITITLLLCFLTLSSFAQLKIKSPDLKIGIGYPYVLGNVDETGDMDSYYAPNSIVGMPTLSVEKPFPIEHKRKNKYSFNPGIAYYFFKEHQKWGNEVKGKDNHLNHQSLSVYSKFLFQKKFYGRNNGFAYVGAIGGFHLLTKSKGTRINYGLIPNEPEVEYPINESGKRFYGSFYYGAVLGVQPKSKITNVIKPSFEAMFFPGLVKREKRLDKLSYEMVAQVTIFLGLRLDK